jgi:hypothetical protein
MLFFILVAYLYHVFQGGGRSDASAAFIVGAKQALCCCFPDCNLSEWKTLLVVNGNERESL